MSLREMTDSFSHASCQWEENWQYDRGCSMGQGGGQYDSWMERGGRGCRLMEKGEWPKGQRLEVTLCQKKKCCSGEKDGNTLSS